MDAKEERSEMNGIRLSPALLAALYADVLVPLTNVPAPVPAPGRKTAQSAPEATRETVANSIREATDNGQAIPFAPAKTEKAEPLHYLGQNRRHICLLVAIPGKDILPVATRTFLEKILAACQLQIDDLAIVNTTLTPADPVVLEEQFRPGKWMLAGIAPAALGMNSDDTPFGITDYGKAGLLCLPALSDMETDSPASRQLKRQLWAALQKFFGL